MMTARDLMDAAKAAQGDVSNYRLARLLDLPEKTVSRWSTGKNLPDDVNAAKLAELAGFDPGQCVAWINAERAAEGPARALWVGIAERLRSAGVALVAFLALGFWTGGPDAGAMAKTVADQAVTSAAPARLYILSTRIGVAVRQWFARLRFSPTPSAPIPSAC